MTGKQKTLLGWALIVIFVIAQILRLLLDSDALIEGFTWTNILWIIGSLILVAAGIMLAAGGNEGRHGRVYRRRHTTPEQDTD